MGYIQIHIVLPEGAIRGRQGLIDANKQKEKLTESTNFSSVSGGITVSISQFLQVYPPTGL